MALISKIHHRVNLIPVVAKADSSHPDEVVKCKKTILASIEEHSSKVYPLAMEQAVKVEDYPFAVIGSEATYQVGDQKVRGRKFKWGVAQGIFFHFLFLFFLCPLFFLILAFSFIVVDNPDHCDFTKLKNLLFK